MDRIQMSEEILRPQLLTLREFRPFKSSDEYLWAMKEDLSDWLNTLYPDLCIKPTAFMECLETGITLCMHANKVRRSCIDWIGSGGKLPKCWGRDWKLPAGDVVYNPNARPETFFARDNVHNFITWCRKLGVFECLLFESDDLILRKNEKNVILCLLEVARRGSHFGMATPLLVQFEKEIDRDIAKDTGVDLSSSGEEEESFQEYGPSPQIITNDLRSLDEMVRELVERCTCPTQFQMIRVAEGKYRIGNTKVMIYVRILRSHCMIRVGGGWDTLSHYLDKHDPCRCSSGHRATVSSKFMIKNNDGHAPRMKVEYERRDLFDPVAPPVPTYTKKTDLSDSSSEISDEGYKTSDNSKVLFDTSAVNGGTNKDGKGHHHSRKSSLVRAQSLSTDEERPDSRSTDDENPHHPRERGSTKSNRTSRLETPTSHLRSASCERPKTGQRLAFNDRRVATTPRHQEQKGKVVTMRPPTRSYSASGTAEFFRGPAKGPSNGMKTQKVRPYTGRVPPFVDQFSGKNTWSGSNSGRTKVRPNLFEANFSNGQTEPDNPDLALWIKKALDLESDADKISHIEKAIKQFEQRQNEMANTGEEIRSTPKLTFRTRKETGMTKIPKPKFF